LFGNELSSGVAAESNSGGGFAKLGSSVRKQLSEGHRSRRRSAGTLRQNQF
jgi:hypothetical protein